MATVVSPSSSRHLLTHWYGGVLPVRLLAPREMSVRPTYNPNKWMALCDCGWSTVSTGPRAEGRVRKRAEEHRCYPPGMPGEGQVSRP